MEITNLTNLPRVLVDVIKNDEYSGHGKLTATTIINHPHLFALKNKHYDEITTDVSSHYHTLLGKSVHYVFEKAGPDFMTEQRFKAIISHPDLHGDVEISAQIDIFELPIKEVTDVKVTTKYKNKLSFEHEAQLNIQAFCMAYNGIKVNSLQLLHIYRDWQKRDKFDHMMPKYPMAKISVPLWSHDQQLDYIVKRLKMFQQYNGEHCDEESRWAKPDVYAVMKPGSTRSRKNFPTKNEAQLNLKAGEIIEHRPGGDIRCQEYCDVNTFCPYYIKKYLCPSLENKGE